MKKSAKKLTLSPDIASFQPTKSPLTSPTSMSSSPIAISISTFSQKYKKQVESVVKIQQSLYQGKLPQKCLAHNISYSLYCETDHKILCTRCMYQNNMHKLHTVKPLNQCVEMIEKDCAKLDKEMEKVLEKLQEYTDYISAQITRIQRQYPPAKDKIEQTYKYLHQFLFDQQKQSIKSLRVYKSVLLEQQKLLSKELSRVKNYVEQKYSKYKAKYGEEGALVKKDVFVALMNTGKVLSEELKIDLKNKEEKYKYAPGMNQTIKEFFDDNLQKLFPWGNCKLIMKDRQAKRQKEKKQNQKQQTEKAKKTLSPGNKKLKTESPAKETQTKKLTESKLEVSQSKQLPTKPDKSPNTQRSSKNLVPQNSNKKIQNSPNYQSRKQLMQKNSLLVENEEAKSQRKRSLSKSFSQTKDKSKTNEVKTQSREKQAKKPDPSPSKTETKINIKLPPARQNEKSKSKETAKAKK